MPIPIPITNMWAGSVIRLCPLLFDLLYTQRDNKYMPPLDDLIGKRFGLLTVTSQDTDQVTPNGTVVVRWACRCVCDIVLVVSGKHLRLGHTRSCGRCLRKLKQQQNGVTA